MKRTIILLVLVLLAVFSAAGAENQAAEISWTQEPVAHFATVEEGQERMRNRTLFHEQLNEKTLAFCLQKKGGTLEEYIEYSAEQVLAFTPEEEQKINEILSWLTERLKKYNLHLPDPGPITFVKSTMKEVSGASAYTSGGTIFLGNIFFPNAGIPEEMYRHIIFHEMSHCLSRLFPEYRQTLYSLIHFTVTEDEIEIPENLSRNIIVNPDVERHNSYATFTIGGEKKDCYLLFMNDSDFEKPGDSFVTGQYTGIVPLGEDRAYRIEEVEDFWDVISRNTYYSGDPEELMADNFGYALIHLDDGYEAFDRPAIMEGILDYLRIK